MAKMNRLDFFKGLGAGALLLNPMLSMLARAQSIAAAKRFIYVFTANGTILNRWTPTTGSSIPGSLSLSGSEILSPLESFKNKITVVQGVNINLASPGDDHVKGCLMNLTAIENNEGTVYTVNTPTGYNKGKSIDQYIAEYYKSRSIVAGCQSGGFFSLISSKGNNLPVTPVVDPVVLHNSIFTGVVPDSTTTTSLSDSEANNVRNKSILDFALADMNRLTSRLPATLASKLKDHADAIRTLERSISLPPPPPPSNCQIPTIGASSYYNDNGEYLAAIEMQMKNIIYAMACGLSNSAVLLMGNGVDQHRHTWLGIEEDHHSISHLSDGTASDKLTQINKWYSERFKTLLTLLQNMPENGGTMLDNSIVVWGNELQSGASHSRTNIPYVIAGGAGGKLPGGRYMNFGNRGHGELLVSIANAMGINISSYNTGTQALNGLLV